MLKFIDGTIKILITCALLFLLLSQIKMY